MKAKIVKIGNSKGIRLPKPLIEQAGLTDEVELEIRDGEIVISRISRMGQPREGWAEAAQSLASQGDDELLARPLSTLFDREEWKW